MTFKAKKEGNDKISNGDFALKWCVLPTFAVSAVMWKTIIDTTSCREFAFEGWFN